MEQIENGISLSLVTEATVRLAQLLAQESAHLKAMQIREVEKLQKQKIQLTSAIESMQKEIARSPALKGSFSDEELEEYSGVCSLFKDVLRDNQIQLKVACDINSYVMMAIKDSLSASAKPPQYNGRGKGNDKTDRTLSMSINDVV